VDAEPGVERGAVSPLPPDVALEGRERVRALQGGASGRVQRTAANPKMTSSTTSRKSPDAGTGALGATNMPETMAASSGAPMPSPIFATGLAPVLKPQ